jgi:two-component system cell cycle response regulator
LVYARRTGAAYPIVHRILVVDDQDTNRALLRGVLSRRGYKVTTAASGEEALAIIDGAPPDLVLLDIFMPKVSGLEVIEKLRQNDKTAALPVILVSALADTGHIVAGLDRGANDYVTKPFVTPVLLARIEALLRSAALVKRLEVQTELLAKLAAIDELTGLYNRRSLFQALETERSRSVRYRRPLSVAMIDLDHFKRINEEYGHTGGDDVLREFGVRLIEWLRTMDIACRYGGEEFCAILPETSLEGALVAAQRIRRLVEAQPFTIGTAQARLTVSVGVSGWIPSADEAPDLLNEADIALLEAKRSGRNRICAFPQKPSPLTPA